MMDSKVVNREIKKFVWPLLKAAGFGKFTARRAWRHQPHKIDVVEFRSFNKYDAECMGVTTFSFSLSLGILPLYVPPQWPPDIKDGLLVPSEPSCYFRRPLLSSLQSDSKYKSIWSVDSEARNLAWCIQDVVKQIPDALVWFEQLNNKHEVLRVLLEDESTSELYGFGSNSSPIRSYLTGYVALSLGDRTLAEEKLQEAVDSKRFVNLFSSVAGAINRAV